jgi:LPS O-antigen subunit length determinant protein (WzzB/FepE family)
MNNNANTNSEYEIDLREFFLKIWRGKIYIIFFCAVSVYFASAYLQTAPRLYSVTYKLKPVGENNQKKASFSGFSGLASIAGIQLPSANPNDFMIYKELFTSADVSEIVLENKELIKKIFANEWNSSTNSYSEPTKSKTRAFIDDFKRSLTGNNYVEYSTPNKQRLAIFIAQNIVIHEDKRSGFLKISSETSNPELMLSIIIEVAEATDKIMRQRYIDFSIEPLAFYKEKLRTARSREHREGLAELISKEEQKLMFASKGKHFIAEPYINPTISLHPTAPKPKSILALSLVFGLLLGVALVLIRHAIKKEN